MIAAVKAIAAAQSRFGGELILFLHNRYRTTGGEERAVAELMTLVRDELGEEAELLERDSAQLGRGRAARGLLRGGLDPDDVGAAVKRTNARIVHAHNLNPSFGPRALHAARQAGAKVVLHLHNYRLVCAVGTCFNSKGEDCTRCQGRNTSPGVRLNCRGGSRAEALSYAIALARHQRALVEAADVIVVPSDAAAERLEALKAPLTEVHVVGHVVRDFAPRSTAAQGTYALVASRLAPEKGVETAIEACRSAGVELVVAGDGPHPLPRDQARFVGRVERPGARGPARRRGSRDRPLARVRDLRPRRRRGHGRRPPGRRDPHGRAARARRARRPRRARTTPTRMAKAITRPLRRRARRRPRDHPRPRDHRARGRRAEALSRLRGRGNTLTPMRTLVTGGAGFIGSNLVDALLARGDEVVVIDNLTTGRESNLDQAKANGADLVKADIREGAEIARIVAEAEPEAIFHLAAQIDVRKSVADPAADARINVEGTANVLEAARQGRRRAASSTPAPAAPSTATSTRSPAPRARRPRRWPATAPASSAPSSTATSTRACTACAPSRCATATSTARARTRSARPA